MADHALNYVRLIVHRDHSDESHGRQTHSYGALREGTACTPIYESVLWEIAVHRMSIVGVQVTYSCVCLALAVSWNPE